MVLLFANAKKHKTNTKEESQAKQKKEEAQKEAGEKIRSAGVATVQSEKKPKKAKNKSGNLGQQVEERGSSNSKSTTAAGPVIILLQFDQEHNATEHAQ